MNHLFYIHSHITYLVSLGIILSENLDNNKIQFLLSRKYRTSLDYKSLDLSTLYNYLEEKGKVHKLMSLGKRIRKLDIDINKLVNNQCYKLYVPQSNHSIFQIIATHPLCAEMSIIEEGITSYSTDDFLYAKAKHNFVNYILSFFFDKRFKLGNGQYAAFPAHKFKTAYCFDKMCFPRLKNKIVLDLKNIKNKYSYHKTIPDQSVLLVMDSFKERSGINKQDYTEILKTFYEKNCNRDFTIFIKFHPEQNEEMKQLTIDISSTYYKSLEILSDEAIIEFEFLNCKDLKVLGFHTSLLFYGAKLQHSVTSGIGISLQNDLVKKYVQHIMDPKLIEIYKSYDQENL